MDEVDDDYDPVGGIALGHRRPSGPEYDLWHAVLLDAIRLAHGGLAGFSGSQRRHAGVAQRDARAWIASDADAPFTFVWACDMLGVDVAVVRRTVPPPGWWQLHHVSPTKRVLRARAA